MKAFCTAIALLLGLNGSLPNLAAAAGIPLIDFDPTQEDNYPPASPDKYFGFYEEHGDGMVGWTFQLNDPVTITQVGIWDQGGDGLSRAFQVGLWQGQGTGYNITYSDSGALFGSDGVTVPGDTTASLNGIYRVVDLPKPLNLAAGNYELGMLDTATTTDPIQYVFGGPSNSQATIGEFFYAGTDSRNTLGAVPADDLYAADGLEVGPMLFTVPEPSAMQLVAGLLLVVGIARPIRYRSKLLNQL